ncbi:hypothetical protein, partial [Oscillatoria sp. HE19RPO]|uniref:hypothetical protein n=1 Tax=Oscillatoria sp. HE19RPO TaxID=2954806 RepID=UPI0020C3E315
NACALFWAQALRPYKTSGFFVIKFITLTGLPFLDLRRFEESTPNVEAIRESPLHGGSRLQIASVLHSRRSPQVGVCRSCIGSPIPL